MKLVMKHAYDEGLITEIPEIPKKVHEPSPRFRFLTDEEEVALLNAFNKKHWRDLTKFQLSTLVSVSERPSLSVHGPHG